MQHRAHHITVVGRLVWRMRFLLETLGIPGFGKSHDRRSNNPLTCPCLIPGTCCQKGQRPPSLRLPPCTSGAEILLSFPFFFGNSAAGTTLCWVSSVTFWARAADKYSNHANNRHLPKSCRVVVATTCWEQTPRASSRT